MKTQDYWEKRFDELAKKNYDIADNSLASLKALFQEASDEISVMIQSFYAKYGVIRKSPTFKTLADGTQVIDGESIKRIVNIQDVLKYNRLLTFETQMREVLISLSKEQNTYMVRELSKVAENGYYESIFEIFKGNNVGFTFKTLDNELVKQLIKSPVNGADFSTRIWDNRDLLANQVNQILRNGLTQGISTREMTERLASKMNSGYKVAETLMRTEITNSYAQATKATYENSGVVKKYKFIATIDKVTSKICANLDGEVFDLDKAIAGLNYPPMHPNCRSTTTAYFDDAVYSRIARMPSGETYLVPSNMTYTEWKEKYIN